MTRYIDADALTDELIRESEADTSKSIQTSFAKSVCLLLCKALELQPTIEAEPVRHGKWITEECLPGVAVCSICGHEIRGIGCQYTKYCDECGARMDEE